MRIFVDSSYIYEQEEDSRWMMSCLVSVPDGQFFSPIDESTLPIVPKGGTSSMELNAETGEFYALAVEPFPAAPGVEEMVSMMDFSEHFEELVEVYASRDGHGLKVESFEAQGNLLERTLYVSLTLDTEEVLRFHIGDFEVTVREISGYLNYNPHNTGLSVSGTLILGFTTKFEIELGAQYEDGLWCFSTALVRGSIPLSEILERTLGWQAVGVELSVDRISIWFRTDGAYALALGISTRLPVFDGAMEIAVEGELERRDAARPPSASLKGSVEIQEFLFGASARIVEGALGELRLSLRFGDALLSALYADQVVTVEVRDLTISVLLKLLFKVWRPNVKFYLPKPWDILNRVGFPRVLLRYHTVTKEVSVTVAVNLDLLIVRINGVRFSYERPTPEEEPRFMVYLNHEWLARPLSGAAGERFTALSWEDAADPIKPWDALNGDSPSPLSEAAEKLLRIDYFGIGRYIDLNLGGMEDGKLIAILDQARKSVEPQEGLPAGRYSTAYRWFVGARFTILDCFDAALLFYDPVLYGLSVSVSKNEPLPLKGLELTVYYRKVTDQIGLFYVNASLPDCIRQMRFGALSFSLPDIEVWLYTNGNFKINFGFPYDNDFSNCFSLSYGIFSGRGGFYFGYLCGDTSSQVPATDRGVFNPVIELGIGFMAEVGTSLNAGVLKLTARLQMTAVFTGVFAKFSYYLPVGTEQAQWYYKCMGMVSVAGEISGEVNFFVISVSFRLYARIALCLTLEDGEEGRLLLEAALTVAASIKILFIQIKFSFTFEFKAEYVLGDWEPRPWKEGARGLPARNLYVSGLSRAAFDGQPLKAAVAITPYFSKDGIDVSWEEAAGEWGAGRALQVSKEKVAFLFTVEADDFVSLIRLLTERAIRFLRTPKPIRFYRRMDRVCALYDRQDIYHGDGTELSLWKTQADLAGLQEIHIEFWEEGRVGGGMRARGFVPYRPAALLELRLARPDRERQVYQICSAPPRTIERASAIRGEEVEGVTVLFSRSVRQSGEGADCVSLSADAGEFLSLLGEMLNIGGDGHYMVIDHKLDELLFDEEGELSLFLLVSLKGTAHADRLVLSEGPGPGMAPVIVNPELGAYAVPTAGPGYAGFEFTVAGEKDGVRPFHLLYYRLFGELSKPVSMQEGEGPSDGLYYGVTAKLPPLPGGDGSPYERVLPEGYGRGGRVGPNMLDLELSFADLTGNLTAQGRCLKVGSFPILYYDNLYALTELPFTSIVYGIERQGAGFVCQVHISPLQREETADGLERLVLMRHQAAQRDVRISIRFGLGDATCEAYLEDGQKELLIQYMEGLYEYLQGGGVRPRRPRCRPPVS